MPQRVFSSGHGQQSAILNEFYKKGCQETTSPSTGGRGNLGLDLQPTAWMSTRICARVGSERFPPVVFSAGDNKHIAVADARYCSPPWCDCSQLLTSSELLAKFQIRQLRPDVELCAESRRKEFLGLWRRSSLFGLQASIARQRPTRFCAAATHSGN